jgi:hypothetical protein
MLDETVFSMEQIQKEKIYILLKETFSQEHLFSHTDNKLYFRNEKIQNQLIKLMKHLGIMFTIARLPKVSTHQLIEFNIAQPFWVLSSTYSIDTLILHKDSQPDALKGGHERVFSYQYSENIGAVQIQKYKVVNEITYQREYSDQLPILYV